MQVTVLMCTESGPCYMGVSWVRLGALIVTRVCIGGFCCCRWAESPRMLRPSSAAVSDDHTAGPRVRGSAWVLKLVSHFRAIASVELQVLHATLQRCSIHTTATAACRLQTIDADVELRLTAGRPVSLRIGLLLGPITRF